METQKNSPSMETIGHGKFASPSEEIFMQSKHVGTIYKWDDGLETTIWFSGSKPEGDCVSRTHRDQRVGWRKVFSINN